MTEQKLDIVLISEAYCTNSSSIKVHGCCAYLTNQRVYSYMARRMLDSYNSEKQYQTPNHLESIPDHDLKVSKDHDLKVSQIMI